LRVFFLPSLFPSLFFFPVLRAGFFALGFDFFVVRFRDGPFRGARFFAAGLGVRRFAVGFLLRGGLAGADAVRVTTAVSPAAHVETAPLSCLTWTAPSVSAVSAVPKNP
jgi:hypothetical protein